MRTSLLVGLVASVAFAALGCGSSSGKSTTPGFEGGVEKDTGVAHDAKAEADAKKPADASHDSADASAPRDAGDAGADAGADAGMDATTKSDAADAAGDGFDGNTTPALCTMTAPTATRGSAIALSPDGSHLVVVNRDVGTATVMSVTYDASTLPVLTQVAELTVGAEPWQVVIDACGANAYVVLRKDQKVVAINGVDTASPRVGFSAAVGSEPTSLALTPNNTVLYVSNWVDGTVTSIAPQTMAVTGTIDLNTTLATTGLLGPDVAGQVTDAGHGTTTNARAAIAHPRGIAVTNNGDGNDADETVYVTEWYAVRTAPESLTPKPTPTTASVSDTNWKGLLYTFPVSTEAGPQAPTTIDLPPVASTGFADANGNATGCFPNQVASLTLNGGFAYVSSTCASPAGPTGVFQKSACAVDVECVASNGSTVNAAPGSCVNGACMGACTQDSDCGVGSAAGACGAGGVCAPLASNAKTTTHPGLTIVDLSTGTAVTSTLDTRFATAADTANGVASSRMPLLPVDIDFKGGAAYVAAEGADALFQLTTSAGVVTKVGSTANDFIDLRTSADPAIRLPIGVAVSQTQAFAFVANDGDRNVEAVDLTAEAVAVGASGTDFRVLPSTALPTGAALSILDGKRAFTTGLGRWSLNGAAWGSCAACHVDGLSDNVTWYFARGPRQTVSLDGTFNKADSTDQRILNWSAVFDEIADFESNVRGISGGVGAIVSTLSTPPVNSDRVNLFNYTPNQQGLEGSSTDVANPASTTTGHSVLASVNWADIQNYVASIRSPRRPTNLVAADVTAGAALFSGAGNCVGCHSGGKWTISKVFYTPANTPNDSYPGAGPASLSLTSWASGLNGFPAALFPSVAATGQQDMRAGPPPTFEQLQCALRPVGTIEQNGATPGGVSPAMVNVQEVRQNMVTGAQGAGGVTVDDVSFGYNPPSLLGLQVGAPFFHAGNARSLEELFTGAVTMGPSIFAGHHASALAPTFAPSPTQIRQLVAFLLSIDGSTAPLPVPALSSSGGVLCHY
jgi:DNA-binding beta-propeller fold protein YncE